MRRLAISAAILMSLFIYKVSYAETFLSTGSLGTARFDHQSALLPNGKVLVAGGDGTDYNVLATAELYDPTTGLFTATGSMGTARHDHAIILLNNGKAMVLGGYNGTNGVLGSAELYNASTGTFTATGSMGTPRQVPTATALPN